MSEAGWIDRHSVTCRVCGNLTDERECVPAPGDDGGSVCAVCAKASPRRQLDEDHCPDCGGELDFDGNEDVTDFHTRACGATCASCGHSFDVTYELAFTGFLRTDGDGPGELIDAEAAAAEMEGT